MTAGIIDRDLGWKRIAGSMKKAASGPHTKVGILASKNADEDHDGINMVELATIHEFGAPEADIEPRSFIGDTIDVKSREINAFRQALVGKIYDGKLDTTRALGLLGEKTVALIRKRIKDRIPPELAESTKIKKTVAGKTGDTPLIDTGRLWAAIAQEVVSK